MARKVCIVAALFAILAGTAAAQDVQSLLRTVSKNMGADNLTSIQYSGSGVVAAIGQAYSPNDDYPKFEVTSYTRTIDYGAKSSKEDLIRRQGKFPVLGGGGTPLKGDQHRISFVSGDYAWNSDGTNTTPTPADAEVRQLEIWLTPHGCIKAAMASPNPTLTFVTFANNAKHKIVTFTALNKYRVNIIINEKDMVERVQTWIANPFFGDMLIEHRYTEYKDYNGVKVPGLIHSHQGLFRLNIAHNSSEYRVTSAQPNVTGAALVVPDAVREARVSPVRVASQKLAEGVWLIGGGTHNSVAVEFKDFVTVVEAPLNEDRSLAVIAEIAKLVPNKPIQYVVNTHHHFDHSGGLRTYEAQGATIVTHQNNYDLYEHILLYPAPRTLQPDRLSTQYPWFRGRELIMETVKDNQKYVISDGVRTLDVYPLAAANTLDVGLTHSANMLIAYLPTEKILINADMYSPAAAGTPPPAVDNGMTNLARNIQRLKLDVRLHVPIHGNPGTHEDFLKIVGTRRSQANPE
jgi:glyoxylase-like metal-dependent hydrolase (beta-lactamase superfamily II)